MSDATTQGASVVDQEGDRPLYVKLKPGPGHSRHQVQRHQQARLHGAMLDAVSSYGFRTVTVRRLIALASVSTATFYQHFANVEDCFVSTHQTATERILLQANSSRAVGRTKGLAAMLTSLLLGFSSNPKESKLVLLEAYSAGPEARSRISQTEDIISELIGNHLSGSHEVDTVPRLATGLTAAVTRIARASLDREMPRDPRWLGDFLADWVSIDIERRGSAVSRKPAVRVAERRAHDRDHLLRKLESAPGERSRTYAAVVRLSVSEGIDNLTASRVCAQAGVPRRTFEKEFGDPLRCLLDLAGRIIATTANHARRVSSDRSDPIAYLRSAGTALCEGVAHNPAVAHLCWAQIPREGGLEGLTATDRWISSAAVDLASALRDQGVDRVTTEAALAAAWAVIRRLIEERRIGDLIDVSPSLAGFFNLTA